MINLNNRKKLTAVILVISSGHPIKLNKTVLINKILPLSETVKFVIKEDNISLK